MDYGHSKITHTGGGAVSLYTVQHSHRHSDKQGHIHRVRDLGWCSPAYRMTAHPRSHHFRLLFALYYTFSVTANMTEIDGITYKAANEM